MLTLKRAFPKMTRFLICTLIIYAGFVFCGWLVLGPFHIKVSFSSSPCFGRRRSAPATISSLLFIIIAIFLILIFFFQQFRSISRTSENLFSLINGDDMFATFIILETNSQMVWWYSRIYLYSFVCLFIYVVLNLFLSVILDAYETIKVRITKFYCGRLKKEVAER